jgi:hypothetical protein
LSHTSGPFCSSYFRNKGSFFAQASLYYFRLLSVAGMIGMYHYSQPFSVEMGSCKSSCLGWPGALILLITEFG